MSYIYVLESGENYCKVGKTINPELRVDQIKCTTGLDITRVKFFECKGEPFVSERMAQKELEPLSCFLEWFRCPFELACDVVEKHSKIEYKSDKKGKPVKIHESVHVMLEEIIKSGYEHKGMPHKKPSKASIVTELVSKLHKKECK